MRPFDHEQIPVKWIGDFITKRQALFMLRRGKSV